MFHYVSPSHAIRVEECSLGRKKNGLIYFLMTWPLTLT